MPYLLIPNLDQFTLPDGETTVGTSGDARLRLPEAGTPRVHAIVQVARTKRVTIRPADNAAVVHVNGSPLGAQPRSLSHGDRITVAGYELLFGEERKAGSTKHLSRALGEEARRLAETTAKGPSAGARGKLVCLLDGREWTIPDRGLLIGREASCDVVVATSDISRKHASITLAPEGYVLTDTSTNGVLVNGDRVTGSRVLWIGDLIRIGNETFRFGAE